MALQAGGFQVIIVGRKNHDLKGDGQPISTTADGAPYHVVDEYGPRSSPRWKQAWRYALGGGRLSSWLKAHAGGDAQAVIRGGGYSRYLMRLIPLTRKWGIPLVFDLAEWYQPSHCAGGRFGPQRWDVELTLRLLAPMAGNAIAISSFLERHFSERGLRVIRVPPLIDASDVKWRRQDKIESSGRLSLGFIGNAGKKDLLTNAIRGLALIGMRADDVRLCIVGPSRSELAGSLGADASLLEKLAANLEFTGRLAHGDALRRLQQVDFSILLRPDLRYAHAGFPTKLVESLAMGVPVICNLTSDMGMYVRDQMEGLILEDCSPEAFAAALSRALRMSRDQRLVMGVRARQTAVESFDYRKWIEPLGAFLREVVATSSQRLQWQCA